ncbi:GT16-like protein [Mya arenaria]|uniref:GT16-like protein n=1 Tax=Mya arenaria TaxID=6604 RepID=A0ABY7FXR4_MYAAR|nr:GT16-like protein [Mya arenaria]
MYSATRMARYHLCRGRRLVILTGVISIIALFTIMEFPYENFSKEKRKLEFKTSNTFQPENSTKIGQTVLKIDSVSEQATTVPKGSPKYLFPRNVQKDCNYTQDSPEIKTPYKFFVYELPSYFNTEVKQYLTKKHASCNDFEFCGSGKEISKINSSKSDTPLDYIQSVRETQQFSLEPLIHYKLLLSPYRTMFPEKADMFYIPAYTGLNCLTFRENGKQFVDSLFEHLRQNKTKHYQSGKPHFMALSKIEREQGSANCPTLLHPYSRNITFIGIEMETNKYWTDRVKGRISIVVPYPSYVHFIPNPSSKVMHEFKNGLRNLSLSEFTLDAPSLQERPVLLFLAAGTRRSNGFRAKLLDQFKVQLRQGYKEKLQEAGNKIDNMPKQVMLITQECFKDHSKTTIPWMRHSKYCLQPPGDSPTRKSIYDSILSGCIPILFKGKTTLPFEKYLDYTTFSYIIKETVITRNNKTVMEIVNGIPEHVTNALHKNLLKVAKWFQYSLPGPDMEDSDDAVTLILHELGTKHRLNGNAQ